MTLSQIFASAAVGYLSLSSLPVEAASLGRKNQGRDGLSANTPINQLLGRAFEPGRCGPDHGSCGMNVCCSGSFYCHADDAHCGPDSGCDTTYGRCGTVSPKTCSPNSRTTDGRTIGYYQGTAASRSCSPMAPSQIPSGYTHVNYAFASISSTYTAVEANPSDVPLYSKFVSSLRSQGVSPWLSLGGEGFDADHWAAMTEDQDHRQAFVKSVEPLLSKYGFQGIDLDYEFPRTPEESANYATLVQELRQELSRSYGLSITLSADWGSLQVFDAAPFLQYVDWFNFMAYDLHHYDDGSATWNQTRGQANITDVYDDAVPLWYDGIPASKVNLGVGYYGFSYTLQNSRCNRAGCPATGYGAKTPFCGFPTTVPNYEIQKIIDKQRIQPTIDNVALMKQVTWSNQWIAYDDRDTLQLKKKWADKYCFGGMVVWAVDYEATAGSDDPPEDLPVSQDGSCGQAAGRTCQGSVFGDCCSQYNYCGSSEGHCGEKCQPAFGTCS